MNTLSLAIVGAVALASPALAQTARQPRDRLDYPATTETVIGGQNNTGGSGDVIISRGATGADTVTNNSAAGGNANLPERAVPNGSAGGGSGGSR